VFPQDHGFIIKVGGSLIDHAPMIARTIWESKRNVLIIPGGGIFADLVRKWEVSDSAAHFMAIAAMDQYGWFLSSYGLPVTTAPRFEGHPVIFLPYQDLMRTDPLAHSWDVTSDTISAYYAHVMGAPLLILKSVDYIHTPDGDVSMVRPGIETNDLDPAFISYVERHHLYGFIMRGSDRARLVGFLRGEEVPGTWFGGTL